MSQHAHAADKVLRKCNSWETFVDAAASTKTTKAQGDLFERLNQLYLQTHTEYRTKLKNVWLLDEVPKNVKKRLGLPDQDEGIDLVAETREGEHWAIQCKYRSDQTRALNTRDLSKFSSLTFVYCKGFSLGVIAHTSSQPVRKKRLLGDVTEIGLANWIETTEEDWRAIRARIGGKATRPKKRSPRAHQRTAVKKAKEHFTTNRATRGCLIMPCGTGKSLTAFWIAEALEAKKILIAVPSLALISQSLKDWTREYLARGIQPEWFCVCSDETADSEVDDFVADTYAMGIPAKTDEASIVAFLRRPARQPKIVFTTYQSSDRLAAAARKAKTNFDLAIFDEAHKTVGKKKKRFATLLLDKNIIIKKRLFMTATERVLTGSNEDVMSMGDSNFYGDRFYELSFKAAIDAGIICDYTILTVAVTDQRVRELIEENRLLSEGGKAPTEREATQLAAGIALKRVFSRLGAKHALSFHRSIKAADRFREQQDELNSIRSLRPKTQNFHVSSKKSVGERVTLLKEFESCKRSLITNAKCLTEGVDIPAIDCVVFADPKRSKVGIVQAAGRAMRRSPGKKQGYILLPLLVPSGMNFEEFAETTAFKDVATTLNHLSTMDERVAEYFRAFTEGKKPTDKVIKIVGDVPVGMEVNIGQFAKSVQLRAWEKLGRTNWRPFEEARDFVHQLLLKSSSDWRQYATSNRRPPDIPTNPQVIYRGVGWSEWGDWLGSGRTRNFLPFEEARDFVRALKLENQAQWTSYAQSPEKARRIPASPQKTYQKSGWAGIGDWLGTGSVAPRDQLFRDFESAREFARSLKFRGQKDWNDFCRAGARPSDIPANPDRTYKKMGWSNWGDWLGTDFKATYLREYWSFSRARREVHKLRLETYEGGWLEAKSQGKIPQQIPRAPDQYYKGKGWDGWSNFLGNDRRPIKRNYKPFDEARKWARSLRLSSGAQWIERTRQKDFPLDIPTKPERIYRATGWMGMGNWLGSFTFSPKEKAEQFKPFAEARKFAQSLNLTTVTEWREFAASNKRPPDIPNSPHSAYRDKGWVNYGDWLGTGKPTQKNQNWRPFLEAREYAQSLNLKGSPAWRTHIEGGKLPWDIPRAPHAYYRDQGWVSWGDFLGTGSIATHLRPTREFGDARRYARTLNIGDVTNKHVQWHTLWKQGKHPADIPRSPDRVYKESGWVGWPDWLGTNSTYKKFAAARAYARSLGLKNMREWGVFVESGECPDDIPKDPKSVYRKSGWQGVGDWLGTRSVRGQDIQYRLFSDAREFARDRLIATSGDWERLADEGSLPDDIPKTPSYVYRDTGWISWADWLGTRVGKVKKTTNPLPFIAARAKVRELGLRTTEEWREYRKSADRPIEIPGSPNRVYRKHGWVDWADWLGKEKLQMRSFALARSFSRKLGFQGPKEWNEFSKTNGRPSDIPSNPQKTYQNLGWAGWPDWLGYERKRKSTRLR